MTQDGPLPGCSWAERAFDLLPQPVALTSADGKVKFANPAFLMLFMTAGATPGEAERIFARPGSKQEPRVFERNGKSWRALPHTPPARSDALTLWTLEEVTAGVQSAEETAIVKSSEGQSPENRGADDAAAAIKSRDESLAMIVHDLRGPLSGIRGTLDFALEDPDLLLPDLHKELITEAREEASRMMNLVNEILDFTKIRAGRYQAGTEAVSPAILVRRAVLAVRTLAQREAMTIETDIGRNLPAIAGNTDKLLQVFNNLLINAFKFTKAGGLILISAEQQLVAAGARILIAITDTGPGIPLEKQDELFSKFAQIGTSTDKDIAGTGLGLYITKSIVEAHGGTISFASIPGVGTSFLVGLPVYEKEPLSSGKFKVLKAE